jgi:putative ABC transport system permease protein
LSIGIAASLLILQYVKYERSFDTFHSRAKDIYRIQYNGYQNGQLNFESAVAVPAVGPALKNNFPEVEEYTRFLPMQGVISYERPGEQPISFHERKIQYADTNIFKVFDFKILEGSTRNCLKGINKVIISKNTAAKYFGKEDAIGKRINLNGDDFSLEVTGIFEEVPENSHIKFDFLISYETINSRTNNQSETSWGWYDFYTFILLKPGTNIQSLQKKWDQFVVKDRTEDWKKSGQRQDFILRPLTDIHLYSNLLYETSPEDLRDGDSVYALSIISLLILFIAWVNYVNLATARSFKRANEVGVRKVVGAYKGQLVIQFLIESFILNVIAAIVALLFVRVLWTSFSTLTGWNIPTDYLMQREFWFLVLILFVSGALVSGFYPAIILSSFRPITILKGKLMRSTSGNYLRQGLVVFQFAATLSLISGSLIVFQQLKYMKNKDLGVNLHQTLVVKGPRIIDSLYSQQYETFKTEVLAIPGIKSISASSSIPGEENYWTNGLRRLSPGGPEGRMTITNVAMDHEYVPQYGIRVIAGRNFDKRYPNDNDNVLINQSLSKDLGFKTAANAIGEKLTIGQDTVEIIGVLADYHQMSLKAKVIPVAFRFFPSASYYSIKLETQNYQAVLQSFAKPWASFFPGNPMEYFFLDEFFNRQYERDDRFGKVFTLFTGLAIFTAALGLLGLFSFMALQRTREIGIRKVFGSSVSQIILLLSQGLMKPVFVSILISIPLGWWVMDKWLESFPYRTEINVWVFGVAGIIVVLVAFLSVASQALKAATTKPAETLKYE